jgi:hypothetical protein
VADHRAARGDEVVILSRRPRPEANHRTVVWDGRTIGAWASELDGAVLLNLAGELVDQRPTKQAIARLILAAVDALSDDNGVARGLEGPVHVCSPVPVRNSELMAALRRACHRPSWAPPTPRFAVRIGAPILGTDAVLALTGRRCLPKRLTDAGFGFHFDDIDEALADLLGGKH